MSRQVLILSSFLLILYGCHKESSPSAKFSSTVDYSTSPLSVQFVNQATNAVSYSWDFGDSTILSNEPNPVHTFPSKGTYEVTLKVSNSTGSAVMQEKITLGVKGVRIKELDVDSCALISMPISVVVAFGNHSKLIYTTAICNSPASLSQMSPVANIKNLEYDFEDVEHDEIEATISCSPNPAGPFYPLPNNSGSLHFRPRDYTTGTNAYPRILALRNMMGTTPTVLYLSLYWK